MLTARRGHRKGLWLDDSVIFGATHSWSIFGHTTISCGVMCERMEQDGDSEARRGFNYCWLPWIADLFSETTSVGSSAFDVAPLLRNQCSRLDAYVSWWASVLCLRTSGCLPSVVSTLPSVITGSIGIAQRNTVLILKTAAIPHSILCMN